MTPESLPPPVWVDEKRTFDQMIADLSTHVRVAVDTESNSLHAYREQVCLIQFSTPKTDYLVDPLALVDLQALASFFSNPKIEKIFHAAEYDLICLKRDFGFDVHNLFDTMQAARILGYSFVGLDNLLLKKFGIRVDKRHQKADWATRPLPPEQIDYARYDTHYLFRLRDVLEAELRAANRWELALEDFTMACSVNLPKEKVNGSSWRRFQSRKDLSLRELTILSELCRCRDAIAERMDRPPFKVVSDAMLLEIARRQPEKDVDLAGIGLTPRQIRLWGDEILAALRRGLRAPLVKREQTVRPNEAVIKRLERLKSWRKKVAREMNVESDVVLPKVFLNVLAEKPPKSMDELKDILRETPTRFQQFGAQIYRLLGG
ncbi:MAG TPA: ribonuclease D [Anaerolineales bacterium]|nr:ribonuclease D [Anaerolineales bacterium]